MTLTRACRCHGAGCVPSQVGVGFIPDLGGPAFAFMFLRGGYYGLSRARVVDRCCVTLYCRLPRKVLAAHFTGLPNDKGFHLCIYIYMRKGKFNLLHSLASGFNGAEPLREGYPPGFKRRCRKGG